ncbi:MAG: metallophosphoesterase [Pseudomonadota bacterium]
MTLACFLAAGPGGEALASDPTLARYSDEPSNVFWFIQITDTHIDNVFYADGPDKLAWVASEGFDTVNPLFVAATGDLTDSTNGVVYGFGPYEAEWNIYRERIDDAGMTAETWFDLPGNHDVYGDANASFYLAYSVQGPEQGTTQPHWRFDLPFGSYHFVGVATPCNDWLQWPFDNTQITDEELSQIQADLEANTDTNLTIAMGHHNYIRSDGRDLPGGPELDALFTLHGVPYYIHGHSHDHVAEVSAGGVLFQRVNSLGKADADNFCVHAVDNDSISHTCAAARDAWPMIVITAPVDAMLGMDDSVEHPHAPTVPAACSEAPVRALVFDTEPLAGVSFWWDTGETGDMEESDAIDGQWIGTFDARGMEAGLHNLTVEATGTRTRSIQVQVLVEERDCDFSGETLDEDDLEEPVEAPPEYAESVMEDAGTDGEETIEDAMPDPSDAAGDPDLSQDAADTAGDLPRPDAETDASLDAPDDDDADGPDGEMSEGGCGCVISR